MASACNATEGHSFFKTVKHFPKDKDTINAQEFIEASQDLVTIVERLGKLFAPVKYDIQGNIDKIKKQYSYDEKTCLLQLMTDEINNGQNVAVEAILWLNRALWLFELVFYEVLKCLTANEYDVSLKNIFKVSYDASIKKYHNWVAQQIFALICKMSPTLPGVLKSLDVDDVKEFEQQLTMYNEKLHLVRCKIDAFFAENNLFQDD